MSRPIKRYEVTRFAPPAGTRLAVSETGEFVLHAEYEKLELQHWIALMALEQFSTAELSEANCASVDVANRRIRNTANKALEEMAALEIRQKKS